MTPAAEAIGPGGTRTRTDIQALRGFAVIAVILYHSGLGIAPSGYLGVDIFFVVSGYLIGGIVMREMRARRFRLRDFYLRRVRRLAPAALTVLLATTMAAALLLTASAYARFWPQLAGVLTLSINVVLWQQINYFNTMASVEPLLHMWSLAIEEQYYLLLPVALMLVPARHWTLAILAGTIASLAAYLAFYPSSPGAAFYLLPMRAWQIGLGSLAACLAPTVRTGFARALPVAVVIVVGLPFYTPPLHLGYLLAIPACFATFAIIGTNPVPAPRVLAWVGDRSYALYLVHWPLFAFANAQHLGAPLPASLLIALIGLIFALASPLYRFVEEPLRRAPIAPAPRRVWILALAGTAVVAVAGAGGLAISRACAPAIDLAPVNGLALSGCVADARRYDGRCAQGPAPRILLWGDSFSQHLVPGIRAGTTLPIAEASEGGCAPLLGIAPVDLQFSLRRSAACIAFNDSVLAYLARTPSVAVVVLSARYLRYAEPGTRALHGGGEVAPIDRAALVAAQERTAAAVRALGRRVVLVTGPPQAGFDVGQCWERTLNGLPSVAPPGCAIDAATAHPHAGWTARLMAAFARSGTPVITLDPALCVDGRCATAWRGKPLYRDDSHLSTAGSLFVGRRLHLADRIWREAR